MSDSITNDIALKLITVPDPRLLEVCREVVRGEYIADLVEELYAVAASLDHTWLAGRKVTCVGLAAPQLGDVRRVFILRYPAGTRLTFINPVITRRRGKVVAEEEACFSEPGVRARVPRFTDIEVSSDNNPRLKFRGFAARVVQHELDHLDGKLISRFVKIVQ